MTTITTVWSYDVGQVPWKVTAYERVAKDSVVYLRWRETTATGRNWRHESLGFRVRDPQGRLLPDREREAIERAHRQLAELLTAAPKDQVAARLTVGEAWGLISSPERGKYPTDSAHRREVKRSLDAAIALWGAERPWDTLKRADLRELWRDRIRALAQHGRRGKRGAEVTVARLLTVAEWLREEERIPATACVAPKHWKQELATDWRELTEARADYEPARPRHTIEEMRLILGVAHEVDPRFALLLALGAELRLGQVLRARRVDVELEKGEFHVLARGKKRGAVVLLTAGQRRALEHALTEGYLRELEQAGGDYPLFPSSQLPGGRLGEDPRAVARHRTLAPIGRRTVLDWFQAAEQLAGIPHVPGRSTYGLRRAAVDAAKAEGISREALKEHGGWLDTQMPDAIYADQQSEKAREEARAVRAKIRGELDAT